MKRKPRITPETEIVARADKLVGEVQTRYQERYKGETELFGHALNAYRIFLTDFVPTPRPSYGEELMADTIESWTQHMGMTFDKDDRGNVAGILKGNPQRILVLQHHLDIVADMVDGSPVNPHTDSIIPQHIEGKTRDLTESEIYDEELWAQAEDALTTFGADNGAGGAANRAVIERLKKIKEASTNPDAFPTIILLGTVEEEAHLGGVKNLNLQPETMELLAKADYIINDDMEIDNPKPLAIEGAFGLESMIVDMKTEYDELPDEHMRLLAVDLTGLAGGHSGLHAQLQHGGVALLRQLEDVLGKPGQLMDWRLSSFTSGNADNQIAQSGDAVIAVPKDIADDLQQRLGVVSREIQEHVHKGEKATISARQLETSDAEVLTEGATQRVFDLLSDLADLQGTDGTFTLRDQSFYSKAFNLGIVRLTPHELHLETTSRIGQPEEFGHYPQLVQQAAERADAEVIVKDPVKIWPADESSQLPKLLQQAYHELDYDKGLFPDLAVEVVTAGLELGELHELFPKSQNITLGMWIDRIHKPGERMQIPSFLENAMLLMKFTDTLVNNLMSADASPRRWGM